MSLIEWLDEYADFGTKKGRTSLADNVHAVSLCLKAYNPRIRLYEVDKDFLQGFIDYLRTRKTKEQIQDRSATLLSLHSSWSVA